MCDLAVTLLLARSPAAGYPAARCLPTQQGASSGTLTPADLRAAVRRAFRHPPAGASREQALDAAFASLRLLGEQQQLAEATSTAVTEGVHVEVRALGVQSTA